MRSTRRHRGVVLLLLAFVIGGGLALQLVRGSSITDHAGNALYAAAAYLAVCFAAPGTRPWVVFTVTMGICVAVEAFQLTHVPAQLAELFPPAQLLLGSTFAWPDLVGYGIGAIASGMVDLFAPERPAARRRRPIPGLTGLPVVAEPEPGTCER